MKKGFESWELEKETKPGHVKRDMDSLALDKRTGIEARFFVLTKGSCAWKHRENWQV